MQSRVHSILFDQSQFQRIRSTVLGGLWNLISKTRQQLFIFEELSKTKYFQTGANY